MDRVQSNNLNATQTYQAIPTEVWRASRNRPATILIIKDTNNQTLHGDQVAAATPTVDTPEEGERLKYIEIELLY
jgi:hypothetical protein